MNCSIGRGKATLLKKINDIKIMGIAIVNPCFTLLRCFLLDDMILKNTHRPNIPLATQPKRKFPTWLSLFDPDQPIYKINSEMIIEKGKINHIIDFKFISFCDIPFFLKYASLKIKTIIGNIRTISPEI